MSDRSGIEWCNATWQVTVGCTRVSPGCDNCYAAHMSHRLEHMAKVGSAGAKEHYVGLTVKNRRGEIHFNGQVRCVESNLGIPLRWRRGRMVFVDSMSDLFHGGVPFEYIDRVFGIMSLSPQHRFQVLTKRPDRALAWATSVSEAGMSTPQRIAAWARHDAMVHKVKVSEPIWPLPNVAIGASVEMQQFMYPRLRALLALPAAVRFLSCEPLLGPLTIPGVDSQTAWCPVCQEIVQCDLVNWHTHQVPKSGICPPEVIAPSELSCQSVYDILHWVIVGGESGQGDIRPMHPDWVRSLRDQCADGGIRFLFKQWGGHEPKLLQWLPGAGEGKPQPEQRFVRHTQWVNKAQSWLSRGDICVDLEGRVCRIGEDFQEARYPIAVMRRSSKKAAGRTLDGVVHDEFPAAWDDWMKEARSGKGGRSEARGKGRGKARGKTRKQRDPAPSPAGAG